MIWSDGYRTGQAGRHAHYSHNHGPELRCALVPDSLDSSPLLPSVGCVTIGKCTNPSVLPFPRLLNGNSNCTNLLG